MYPKIFFSSLSLSLSLSIYLSIYLSLSPCLFLSLSLSISLTLFFSLPSIVLSLVLETYGGASRLPSSRADLAVSVSVLKCLHKAQDLIDTSANWIVIDSNVADNALTIDDIQTTV